MQSKICIVSTQMLQTDAQEQAPQTAWTDRQLLSDFSLHLHVVIHKVHVEAKSQLIVSLCIYRLIYSNIHTQTS